MPRSPTATPWRRSSSAVTAARIGVVPYGVEDPGHDGTDTLERLGLEPRKYILFVGRLEPENNPHLLVEAFSRIGADQTRGMKVAIVGGAPYADDYIRQVRAGRRSARGVPGIRLRTRLLAAPAPRLPVLRSDRGRRDAPGDPRGDGGGQLRARQRPPPNAETVGDAGVYFSGAVGVDDLAGQLRVAARRSRRRREVSRPCPGSGPRSIRGRRSLTATRRCCTRCAGRGAALTTSWWTEDPLAVA